MGYTGWPVQHLSGGEKGKLVYSAVQYNISDLTAVARLVLRKYSRPASARAKSTVPDSCTKFL